MSKLIKLDIDERVFELKSPVVMGIINLTPDSFHSGSRISSTAEAVKAAAKMLEAGAGIIDVGGYSTRPGAVVVPSDEERKRVLPVLKSLRKEFPQALISLDTFRSSLAYESRAEAGVDIINDISGGIFDEMMIPVVARLRLPYILMHNRGTPYSMHKNKHYEDVVIDIIEWFKKRIPELKEAGIESIIADPGIGFSKGVEHNFEILRRLKEFAVVDCPLLTGLSRKSMVWKSLGITPSEALNGTTALNMCALLHGSDILRVHDVKEAVEAVGLYEKLQAGCKSQE